MKLRPIALALVISACDSSPEPKEQQDPPLVEGKADRYATDFILAGELAPGGSLPGALSEVNRFLGYTFYGRAGDSVTVSIGDAASGLDTVLWVYGPFDPERGRWSSKPLAVNDDRPGSDLSTIDTTLGADGMYLAIVTSYQQRTRGAFHLQFACGGCSTQARPGDLVISEIYARVAEGEERFVEIRNAARVPIALDGIDIGTHHATPGLLGPGQAYVATGLALDDGGMLALSLGATAIDTVTYPSSTLDGSLVRVADGTTVTFQPHLELTQGARATSPGLMLDGSPYPNPNTSTRIDVTDGDDAVEDARLDAQAAVAAKFGKSIPLTVSKLVIFGPKLDNQAIEGGLRRFIAALPQLQKPDPAITRISFGGGDANRYGTSVHLDVHDDGRQAFDVLSSAPATETALAQFRADAAAAFAAELPLASRIEPRLLAWLPTPQTNPSSFLSPAGVTVTNHKFETRTSGDYRSDTVTIDLSSSYPSKIRVYIYYAKLSSTVVSSYSITYSQTGLPLLQDTVRSLGLDGARKQKYAQNYKHTAAGKLLRRTFLDDDGNVERVVDVNPTMKPRSALAVDTSEDLDPIYAGLVQRSPSHGRTIVGIFDSGIDYNHPALVHKLHENTADGEAVDAIDSDGNGRVDDFLGWDFDDDDRLPFDYNDFLFNINQSYD
ncbi:MAG: hypothetical protein H0T65_01940, partial [Deltaproteobacteria bacterium]|nr:hypothetical protein [Deltaproteobacteria bacterium]